MRRAPACRRGAAPGRGRDPVAVDQRAMAACAPWRARGAQRTPDRVAAAVGGPPPRGTGCRARRADRCRVRRAARVRGPAHARARPGTPPGDAAPASGGAPLPDVRAARCPPAEGAAPDACGLDAFFTPWRLAVEIDGMWHTDADAWLAD